ncbi:MAG: hypothetical protein R3212_01410, partial [Xanthomonadales bacterium]|nr:hypothetical protein [Xanthomonadales bacterium]
MTERAMQRARVDRYVRDELAPEEMAAFETELLESPDLQEELETVLALRAGLQRESVQQPATAANDHVSEAMDSRSGWQRLALAATVVLAVMSTVMWWQAGNEVADLERQLNLMSQPRGDVLTVAVPIMRSAGGQTPDVIVLKPRGQAAILLDIELGLRARVEGALAFALVDP